MSLILRAVAASHVGLVRTNNEDSWHAGDRLVVVADGVGGMPAGELASQIVVRTLAPLDRHRPDEPGSGEAGSSGQEGGEQESGEPVDDALRALRAALDRANDKIREESEADRAHEGMGTTTTALLLRGDRIAMLHIGDSRAYRLRDGDLEQITRDDTYVQALVDEGVLSADEARHHPQRSIVTKAVIGWPLDPTATVLTPQPGDRYLVCSDGLSDYVTDDAIHEALKTHPDRQDCADHLIDLTLRAGAPDNVTALVADLAEA